MITNIPTAEALEKIGSMIALDKAEAFEETSNIIQYDLVTSLKEDIKSLKIIILFLEEIKKDLNFVTFDNKTEEAFTVSKEESEAFIERLIRAYNILLNMVEKNKEEIENMEF